MYIRLTVELWQAGKEPQVHKTAMNLPEEFVKDISDSTYKRKGK